MLVWLSEMYCKLSRAVPPSQWWLAGGWLEATQALLSVRQWLVMAGAGWQPLTSTSQHLPSLLQPWPLTLGHEEDQPGGGGDGPGVAGPGSLECWWRWLVLADPVFWVS